MKVKVSYCYIHDKPEEVTDTTYLICFECKHVFPTYEQLIKDTEHEFGGVGSLKEGEDPMACPWCLHDF